MIKKKEDNLKEDCFDGKESYCYKNPSKNTCCISVKSWNNKSFKLVIKKKKTYLYQINFWKTKTGSFKMGTLQFFRQDWTFLQKLYEKVKSWLTGIKNWMVPIFNNPFIFFCTHVLMNMTNAESFRTFLFNTNKWITTVHTSWWT